MFCFEGDFQPYLSTMTVTAGKIHSPSFKGSRTGTEIVDPPREKLGENTFFLHSSRPCFDQDRDS